jgi:large subunit ribosomal protein L6
MSRIGRKPIEVPAKVKVDIGAGGAVTVEGPRGKLEWNLPKAVRARVEGSSVSLDRQEESRQAKALHGLARALIANMVAGVSEGFKKELEIQGVGFKAAIQGQKLNLSLGKSHPILFQIPPSVKIAVADGIKITIEGADKHLVGQTAADIRAFYPPEPYKGKGIRYAGEQVRRKEGKTVQ